jgi:DNA-binding beta-propeller fold protein YncE
VRRPVRLVLATTGILLGVVVLTVGAIASFLALRPSAKTIRPIATISVQSPVRIGAPFRSYLPFIDYMSVDGLHLYAASTTQGMVAVIDTAHEKIVAMIDRLGSVHGVAIDTDDGLGFVSDSSTNSVQVFDIRSARVLDTIAVDEGPDAILYDRALHLIYVANRDAGTGNLIDPLVRRVTGRIVLGGKAEYAQADPSSGIIYQIVENTSEVVVVDPREAAIVRRFHLDPSQEPTGLALDSTHQRLFVTGLGRRLRVLDVVTGKLVATLSIGSGSDGVSYDAGLGRIYVANALSATVTVIQQDTPDRYRVLEQAPTHFGGHFVLVDRSTHRIYLAYFGNVAVYDPVDASIPFGHL